MQSLDRSSKRLYWHNSDGCGQQHHYAQTAVQHFNFIISRSSFNHFYLCFSQELNVNVHVFSPDIPLSSADYNFIWYWNIPSMVSSPLERIQYTFCSWSQSLHFSIFRSTRYPYAWVLIGQKQHWMRSLPNFLKPFFYLDISPRLEGI